MNAHSVAHRIVLLAGAAICAAAFACGPDFLHTNPYDPSVPVPITITGPDTIFSYRGLAQYTATSTPAFPDSSVQWTSSDSIALLPSGPGTFTAAATPLEPARLTVRIGARIGHVDTTKTIDLAGVPVSVPDIIWRHSAEKVIVLMQRVTRIQLRCPDTHACDPLTVGAVWLVWVDGTDALGHPIVALTSSVANPASGTPVATFVSRDASIASVAPVGIRAANVTARNIGSTWIVATRGTLLDSLALVVHQ